MNVFENTLKVCRDTGIASPLHSNREVSEPLEDHGSSGGDHRHHLGDDIDFSNRSKTPAPPRQLLALPPLARLVNAFLIGLNEFRRCLLASAFPSLRAYFKDNFVKKARSVLLQNERAVLTPGFLNKKGEDAGKLRSVAIELKEEFEGCVEPYLMGALEVALGSFENIPKKKEEDVVEQVDEDSANVDDSNLEEADQEVQVKANEYEGEGED